MATPTARLEDDQLGALDLVESNGYIVARIDLGSPAARAATFSRPDASGSIDVSSFFGARNVVLQLVVIDSESGDVTRRKALDRLAAYTDPGRRPYLYVDPDGSGERRVQLRGDQFSAPLESPTFAQVQVQWVAPSGVLEDAAEQVAASSAVLPPEPGVAFPLAFPIAFPASSPIGLFAAVNAGTVPVWPVIRLYGPCSDPRVENITIDERIEMVGLDLADGQFVEIDALEATVRLNGDPAQSRYNRLDFTVSTFWRLAPGVNEVRYYPASFSEGAWAEVRFRSAWI